MKTRTVTPLAIAYTTSGDFRQTEACRFFVTPSGKVAANNSSPVAQLILSHPITEYPSGQVLSVNDGLRFLNFLPFAYCGSRLRVELLTFSPGGTELQEAYNPNQPRVPSGHGKASGQWAARGSVNMARVLEAHYQSIRPALDKIAEAYTGRHGQKVEARPEEWTDREHESLRSEYAKKYADSILKDPDERRRYTDDLRAGKVNEAWTADALKRFATDHDIKLTKSEMWGELGWRVDEGNMERFQTAIDRHLETPAGEAFLRGIIERDAHVNFGKMSDENKADMARQVGVTFPTRTIGAPVPWSQLDDQHTADLSDLYVKRVPPNEEAKNAARMDLELDLVETYLNTHGHFSKEWRDFVDEHPQFRHRNIITSDSPDVTPEILELYKKAELIQTNVARSYAQQVIDNGGDQTQSILAIKSEKYQRYQFDQMTDDQKAEALKSAGIELPIYTRTPAQFRPYNSAPGGEQDLRDYAHSQSIARLVQRERTVAIAREKGVDLTPEQADQIAHDIWGQWKSDSGSEYGLALQAACYTELRSHHRQDKEREEKAELGYRQVGVGVLSAGNDVEYKEKRGKSIELLHRIQDTPRDQWKTPEFKSLRDSYDALMQELDERTTVVGRAAVAAHVRATWEASQCILDRAGLRDQPVQTYRAIIRPMKDIEEGHPTEVGFEEIEPGMRKPGHVKLPDFKMERNGAQSTTLDLDKVANTWQGAGGVRLEGPPVNDRVVLRIQTPAASVLSLPVFGQNVHNEQEIVLTGTAWEKWDAWQDKAPRITRTKAEMIASLLKTREKQGVPISREAAEHEIETLLAMYPQENAGIILE